MKIAKDSQLIVLMGIKHSGKSSLGRMIAQKLGYDFIDVDDVIEDMTGISCRQLYHKKGKDAFIAVELLACKEVLSSCKRPLLIATGGGICDNAEALDVLQSSGALLLYLFVSKRIACNRIIASSKKRGSYPPYIGEKIKSDFGNESFDEVCAVFHPFYTERAATYEKIADARVSLNDDGKEKNAQKILDALCL
ncbi:MAG TPA: shikimate kinase [Treponemataceae bacterium]|nr:shikimate kinase [Treponemataceae bacterium]